MAAGGDARKAFKKLDINLNGFISVQEFVDGLAGLKIDWMSLTGFTKPREIFKLFDMVEDPYLNSKLNLKVLTFGKLFPKEAEELNEFRMFKKERDEAEKEAQRNTPNDSKRPSTPQFWKAWCRNNQKSDFLPRQSAWTPASREDEFKILYEMQKMRVEGSEKRKWMQQSFRRLKNRGKSDARVRECIALHLPRGSGPRDRDDCATFSEAEVRECRKAYQEAILAPTKNVQKIIFDMREQRRALSHSRVQLHTVVMKPLLMARAEEERKVALTNFAALSFGAKPKDPGDEPIQAVEAPVESLGPRCPHLLAYELDMDDDFVLSISKEFIANGDAKMELLPKKGFPKVLAEICKGRTLSDADVDAWWKICKAQRHRGDTKEAEMFKNRHNYVNFEQFLMWFADSELRCGPPRGAGVED